MFFLFRNCQRAYLRVVVSSLMKKALLEYALPQGAPSPLVRMAWTRTVAHTSTRLGGRAPRRQESSCWTGNPNYYQEHPPPRLEDDGRHRYHLELHMHVCVCWTIYMLVWLPSRLINYDLSMHCWLLYEFVRLCGYIKCGTVVNVCEMVLWT